MNQRPLTPLERAILCAVVELGDEAYGVPVRRRVDALLRPRFGLPIGKLYAACNRLVEEGYLREIDDVQARPERGGRPRQYWRPAFDLTEILREEAAG